MLSEDKPVAFVPNAWLKFADGGEIIFVLDRVEMGQGVMTALSTIIAEELNLSPQRLIVIPAPAHKNYVNKTSGIQITGGSTSVSASFDSLRLAGATARQMFIMAAAEKWNVPPSKCRSEDGLVFPPVNRQDLSAAPFVELLATVKTLSPPKEAKLKTEKEWRFIGKSLGRLDNLAKVRGQAEFGIDVKLPNLVHAVILRLPSAGATLEKFDVSDATNARGFLDAFPISNGLAVVAKTYWQARQAAQKINIIWREKNSSKTISSNAIDKTLREESKQARGAQFLNRGSVDASLTQSAKTTQAEYQAPFLAHATMEPCNYTAHVQKDRVDLYGPSQSAGMARQIASEVTGMDFDSIHVHTTYLGGGFGRRLAQDYVAEACEVAMRTKTPVKVVWSREEDMQHSIYRPINFHVLKGGIDAKQKINAWSHRVVAPSILASQGSAFVRTIVPEWLPLFMKRMAGWSAQKGISLFNQDETVAEGAKDIPYNIDNALVDYVHVDPGVPLGFWRSVGHSYTAFAVESFIDELAYLAAQDPYKFRLAHLPKKSLQAQVLTAAAELAQWGSPLGKNQGMGIAQHSSFGSHCAQVVQVKIEDKTLTVEKVTCAIVCGTVINPDLVKAQMQSAVNFALSAALYGEITLADGRVEQTNFDSYPVLRMDRAPAIEVAIVAASGPPAGVGEPGVPPLAPALTNAIFAISQERLRKLPLKGFFSVI